MKFAWKYFFVLVWFAYLICSGILLFSRGFLLSRISKKDVSTCRHLSNNENEEYQLNQEIVEEIFKDVNASSSLCLPKKSKVIILLVDALKYEFGLYEPNLDKPLPYQNKLTIFNELLIKEPENTRLLKFVADPPTTTLQRLKGLTTGSLPTFVDIGSNFATPEINEDNIIDQIINNGLSAVFLGDSTWTDLYPKRFKRQYSYPSFDIFDLDTIDKKIEKYLPKELNQNDWDLLIAHFLGVDHCGHRYGPLHSEMSRKLTEMNDIIRKVIEQLDNDTTLLVMGDHGMTKNGDHGGESIDEVDALIFAYSKQNKFISSDFGSNSLSMRQIDLVPTLATILGVPIPYSNLGLINFNLVPDVQTPYMLKYQTLLLHAWQNARQIYNYFTQYAMENTHTFQFDDMDNVENKFLVLTHRVNTIYSETAFKSFIKDLNHQLREILDTCRNIWIKFDANQMSQGLLLTFLPIFFAFLLVNNLKVFQISRVFSTKTILYIYLFNFASGIFAYRYFKDLQMKTEIHSIIFFSGIVSTFLLSLLTVHNWPQIATNWSQVKRFVNFPTRIVFLISTNIYFSNSFIIQEAKILSYLLICLLFILMYDLIRESYKFDGAFGNLTNSASSNKVPKFKLKMFFKSAVFKLILLCIFAISLVRFSWTLYKCREEHGNCNNNFSNSSNVSNKYSLRIKTYIISAIALIMYTTLTRIYLRSCGNLTGFSPNVLLARYGPTVAAICTAGHILLSNSPVKTVKMVHVDGMAWVVYVLLLIQIIILLINPLMTHVLPPKQNTISINPYSSVVPEIFKKIRKIYDGDDEQKANEIPVVYGLATVYSSILISFAVFLGLTIILLLEPKAVVGIIICIAIAAIVLSIHSILRYRTSNSLESCIQPTFSAVVTWYLLAQYCFFATSHQTTLSQIDWRAAFIGRSANFDHSNIISGILVIFNTFCGQIFFTIFYGLLCSETFSIYALFPHLKSITEPVNNCSSGGMSQNNSNFKNSNEKKIDRMYGSNVRKTTVNKISKSQSGTIVYLSNDFDVTRGELILYENEAMYFGCLFKVAIQLFMLQGIKAFCSMMACTIHCRHLMVWKIFAPRFIYEAISTLVTLPAAIIGYLILLRIHYSVNRLINKINKTK